MALTRPLLLIGAGGFARETVEAVRALNALEPRWDLLGYLDDDPALTGKSLAGVEVLGPIDLIADHPDAAVVVCVGRPDAYTAKRRICERIELDDDRYATLIHPSVALSTSSTIGAGSVILAQVVLTADVRVGRHVAVMPQTVLTHDVRIGDWATLASGVRLGGGVQVGAGAYLGSGCCIREGVSIGDLSLIGMGSVVTRDVPPERRWFGVPARDQGAAPSVGTTVRGE